MCSNNNYNIFLFYPDNKEDAYIGRRRAFAEFAFGVINRFKVGLETVEPFDGQIRRRNL